MAWCVGDYFSSPAIPILVEVTKEQISELYYKMEKMCDNDDINQISRHDRVLQENTHTYIYIQDYGAVYIEKTSELCF